MKTPAGILLIPLCCMLNFPGSAQSQSLRNKKMQEAKSASSQEEINVVFSQNQMQIGDLCPEQQDKLIVFNMRGAVVLQQPVTGNTQTLDLLNMEEGVYLLVLRPKQNGKEKMLKFLVRR